jgi:hypothetical protein
MKTFLELILKFLNLLANELRAVLEQSLKAIGQISQDIWKDLKDFVNFLETFDWENLLKQVPDFLKDCWTSLMDTIWDALLRYWELLNMDSSQWIQLFKDLWEAFLLAPSSSQFFIVISFLSFYGFKYYYDEDKEKEEELKKEIKEFEDYKKWLQQQPQQWHQSQPWQQQQQQQENNNTPYNSQKKYKHR